MAQQLSMPQSATQAQTIARRSEHTVAAGSPTAAETALVPGSSVVLEMDFQGLAGFVFFCLFVYFFRGSGEQHIWSPVSEAGRGKYC